MVDVKQDPNESQENNPSLIICCENLGTTSSANAGIYRALREGVATSASLVVPAPWARAAAAEYRGEDIGVSLTLVAEYDLLKWGPITYAPSLLGGDGGFPKTITDIWEHADLDEVRREWRAQVERAVYWGFDVTHLSLHLPGIELRPEFFDAYLEIAEEFQLPVRLYNQSAEKAAGFPFRQLAAERGVFSPDNCLSIQPLHGETNIASTLAQCSKGLNCMSLDTAIDTYELRVADPEWEQPVSNLALLISSQFKDAITSKKMELVGYKFLRNSMRQNPMEQ
jgi:hypothetical protein